MGSCCAFGCTNRPSKKIPGITFHRFALNVEQKEEWVRRVQRANWWPSKYSVLCSTHFTHGMFDRTSMCCVRLKPNAVPTIFHELCSSPQSIQKFRKLRKMRNSAPVLKNAESEVYILPIVPTIPDIAIQSCLSQIPKVSSSDNQNNQEYDVYILPTQSPTSDININIEAPTNSYTNNQSNLESKVHTHPIIPSTTDIIIHQCLPEVPTISSSSYQSPTKAYGKRKLKYGEEKIHKKQNSIRRKELSVPK